MCIGALVLCRPLLLFVYLQYPVRVAQCEAARDEVQKRHPDVQVLRDASEQQVHLVINRPSNDNDLRLGVKQGVLLSIVEPLRSS